MSLCNGHWIVQLVDGYRFPKTIRAKDTTERRRTIEELWEKDDKAKLLQIDVYANGDISVSVPPREIA